MCQLKPFLPQIHSNKNLPSKADGDLMDSILISNKNEIHKKSYCTFKIKV